MQNCKRVMKKIIHLLSFVITGTFLGCSTVTHYNSATGKYETKFVSGTFGMFADVVERDIQGELRGDKIEVSWRDHWIDWCQTLYYNRNLGDSYVQYIIDKRRAAGQNGKYLLTKLISKLEESLKVYLHHIPFDARLVRGQSIGRLKKSGLFESQIFQQMELNILMRIENKLDCLL